MAGGLTIEVEEEVPLVENAAAASLFSPGMWVQRPQARTPGAAPTASQPEGADRHGAGGPRLGSPLSDPDLAYLAISDERESAEKEYLKQDAEHMEALEAEHRRLLEQNRAMEAQLNGVVAAVNDVMDENATVKQLLAMLQVRREDFVFNPQQTIAAQQEAIGLRLLQNLEGSPPGAQQQQEDEPGAGSQRQQQQQRRGADGERQSQQQRRGADGERQSQQQQSQQQLPAPPPLDLSPGSLLPFSTPGSLLRTVSPRIGALRLDAGTAGDGGPTAPPTVVPASPYDFPAESQIAAAALTAKQGDTAAALLTLLDKAIEGRMERQAAAAAAVPAPAPAPGSQPASQAEPAEPEVYCMPAP